MRLTDTWRVVSVECPSSATPVTRNSGIRFYKDFPRESHVLQHVTQEWIWMSPKQCFWCQRLSNITVGFWLEKQNQKNTESRFNVIHQSNDREGNSPTCLKTDLGINPQKCCREARHIATFGYLNNEDGPLSYRDLDSATLRFSALMIKGILGLVCIIKTF